MDPSWDMNQESSVEVASDLSATGTTAGNARAAAVRWPRGALAIGGTRWEKHSELWETLGISMDNDG